ncbi:hypothetical protein [Flavobacterium sp. 28YEA47A]|uniref:hypothetical protein n=1 Tax=Flavobacterium sp. 28YEA47A TaxID=3156276 RepID=UPI0035114272
MTKKETIVNDIEQSTESHLLKYDFIELFDKRYYSLKLYDKATQTYEIKIESRYEDALFSILIKSDLNQKVVNIDIELGEINNAKSGKQVSEIGNLIQHLEKISRQTLHKWFIHFKDVQD